ncbi:unnamed protein product [Mytilus coruscus]|uniref:HAT C-terminal dimerisation domain-containing protein n=1 Tax=Mytilus coruscus TaxID=42192 RepID=A0A6J8D3L4_MYTCO|nr:unnamed protein product [Mytilus coruscus]
MFLDNINVLKNSSSADAETLYKCIKEVLTRNNLDLKKCTSLVTDGASVMVGKKSGVATRLKTDNPSLLSIHCICHRLALSCTDSNTSIKYMNDLERILRQLWTFFENSPKRCAILTKVQLELHAVHGNDLPRNTRKSLTKKVKKACSTRWLSFDQSVKSVYDEFVAITQTLRNLKEKDPTADGLLSKMNTVKFLGVIIILHHVLPKLASLSKAFQQENINFSSIACSINFTTDALDDLVKTQEPIHEIEKEMKEGGRYESVELTPTSHQLEELKNLLEKYVRALKENIDSRFSNVLPVLTAFDVFNPMLVPERDALYFKNYGVDKIETLVDHFSIAHQTEEDRKDYRDEVIASWGLFKYELLKYKHNIPKEISEGAMSMTGTTPTQWALQQLLVNKASYHSFSHLLCFIEIFMSMPVSNAWPERGASAIKRIRTRLRLSLKEDMLQTLLHVNINGKVTHDLETNQVMEQCVANFKTEKKRRKLPNPKPKSTETEKITFKEHADASVQVEIDDQEIQIVKDKIESISKLASILGISNESDDNSDVESEDDCDYDF